MRPLLALLALTSLACAGLAPSTPETDPPPEAPEPLPDGTIPLEALLEPIRAEHGVPAIGAAVVRGSALVAIGAVGERAAGSGRAVTASDRWHLGSVTKSMTATLMARHVAAGRIDWDTTVAEIFADRALHPGWSDVTVAHLLQHRAGPPELGVRELLRWHTAVGEADALREQWLIERVLPAAPEPGSFAYSNAGYLIAGEILEVIDGRPWERQIREDLLAPLGMERSDLGPPPGWHQPWGHRRGWFSGWSPVPPGPGADNPAPLGPAGTVHATLADFARFAAVHLAMERSEPPWDHPAYRWLHLPPEGGDYAAGWVVTEDEDGLPVLWHNGSNTMWYALVRLEPAQDRALLVVVNAFHEEVARAAMKVLGSDSRWSR